jgi:hypothetical protein
MSEKFWQIYAPPLARIPALTPYDYAVLQHSYYLLCSITHVASAVWDSQQDFFDQCGFRGVVPQPCYNATTRLPEAYEGSPSSCIEVKYLSVNAMLRLVPVASLRHSHSMSRRPSAADTTQ